MGAHPDFPVGPAKEKAGSSVRLSGARLLDREEKIMRAPTSVKVLGWLEIGNASIFLVIISAVFADIVRNGGGTDLSGYEFFAVVLLLLAGLMTVGVFLLKGSSRARGIVLVLSAIRLIAFPLGTIWGVLALYFLVYDKEVKKYFEDKNHGPAGPGIYAPELVPRPRAEVKKLE